MATEAGLISEQEMARRSRRSFLGLGAGAALSFAGLAWLFAGSTEDDGIPPAFRKALGFNEGLLRNTVYDNDHLAKTFPASAVGNIKVNGRIGMEDDADLDSWELSVVPLHASAPAANLSLRDIQALPRHEETIEFKCVEGWSTVTQFAGARLSDFTAKYAPGSEKAACVGMNTPDEEYYVSIDMPSAMHPQTLLAYEMNGAPLTSPHGAPLRLVIPVKYGIKNIKRIAKIEYTEKATPDYWAERGYDWYAGL